MLTKRIHRARLLAPHLPWPPNVWMGTSIGTGDRLRNIGELRQIPAAGRFLSLEPLLEPLPALNLAGIDWVIVGGESGPDARPCDVGWIQEIVAQCQAAAVPCFVKQLGTGWARVHGIRGQGRSKGQCPADWPEALQIRQYPAGY